MKFYNDSYFCVADRYGNAFLEQFQTLEQARADREQIHKRQAERGYQPEKLYIYLISWNRTIDENGIYISEQTTKTFVEGE